VHRNDTPFALVAAAVDHNHNHDATQHNTIGGLTDGQILHKQTKNDVSDFLGSYIHMRMCKELSATRDVGCREDTTGARSLTWSRAAILLMDVSLETLEIVMHRHMGT
jgi:hypothetical protein